MAKNRNSSLKKRKSCSIYVCVCKYIHIYTHYMYIFIYCVYTYMQWNIIQPFKKGNSVIYYNMGRTGGHYTKWNIVQFHLFVESKKSVAQKQRRKSG
jgi:hypothetical protein